MNEPELIKEPVAKITKVYSSNGEMSLRLYDNFNDEIDYEQPFFTDIDNLRVALFVNKFSKKGASKAIILFDDIDSEIRALEFVDHELYVYSEPEQSDELYYEDMIGYEVYDRSSDKRGKVVEFVDYSNNPLFAVIFDAVEVMVPINDDVIIDIDEDKRQIVVNLPEGLIELYSDPDMNEEQSE